VAARLATFPLKQKCEGNDIKLSMRLTHDGPNTASRNSQRKQTNQHQIIPKNNILCGTVSLPTVIEQSKTHPTMSGTSPAAVSKPVGIPKPQSQTNPTRYHPHYPR
tara:strand:- start:15858 stop:16175 length:318 start_codon:yes stop_codon:yes gene_type:complete